VPPTTPSEPAIVFVCACACMCAVYVCVCVCVSVCECEPHAEPVESKGQEKYEFTKMPLIVCIVVD
jgi:hypothetical protein